jgi:hypothetical protein
MISGDYFMEVRTFLQIFRDILCFPPAFVLMDVLMDFFRASKRT